MSKYETLCNAFDEAYKQYQDYHQACACLAQNLINAIVDYLEWPKENLVLIPILRKSEPNKMYTVWGAMHLGNDAFYHLGVKLKIGHWPQHAPLLHLLIKKDNQAFTVKIENLQQEFKIHNDRQDEMEAFCDFIFNTIMKAYQKGFLPPSHDEQRRLGFPIPEPQEPDTC